ncbi:MAG: replication-associated recombination protein A [Candidatus Melainabacteria bacterium]|nr:replication-associated recombination protein A [Candidatus Melainabacteria bacterium]
MSNSKTHTSKITENLQISLFKGEEPLAYRIRPKKTEDLIGQEHLREALSNYFKKNVPYSIILWGPPGSGKTSLAHLAKSHTKKEFIYLSGASTSVSELRDVISKSKLTPSRVILFIDEIHRLAKNQQDVLLEPLENGTLTLIGTTTENPLISITRALHSRVKVFELKPHSLIDLDKLITRAITHEKGYPKYSLTEEARKLLVNSSSGDARRLLFNLEEAAKLVTDFLIDEKIVKTILENSQLQIGADEENYYNCISALQKSIRGSDADAALYWLARLLAGGADPVHVARRILVTASEDIGLADNNALGIATSAYQAAQFLGMPEARIPLAQAVIYLACAPKSNTTITSIDKAIKDATELPPYVTPMHIRNLGGKGYKYPHSYKDAKVEQEYLPKELKGKKYFVP